MNPKNHIILIGLPGVGKTSVGKRLSKLLDINHVDIDREIEKDEEMSLSKLITQKGEAVFRGLEKDKLKVIIDSPSPLIASSGGGIILDDENRQLIKEKSMGVYLICDVDEITKRLNILNRPLLYDTNKKGQLGDMLKDREKFYREVSEITVDITGLSIQNAAQEVCSKVEHVRT